MMQLILYTTDDGKSQIQLRADLGTVWLTQLEMAGLFDATKQNISLHLKNFFEGGILQRMIFGGVKVNFEKCVGVLKSVTPVSGEKDNE
jgi:hypothetical protein